MTADRTPRVGQTITTAEQIEALPEGAILRTAEGRAVVRTTLHDSWEITGDFSDRDAGWLLADDAPLTVVFVPGEQPTPPAEDTHTDVTEQAAQALTDYLASYTLPANYSQPVPTGTQTHRDVANRCGPLIAEHLRNLGLLATAPTTTVEDIARRWHEASDHGADGCPCGPVTRRAAPSRKDTTMRDTDRRDLARVIAQAQYTPRSFIPGDALTEDDVEAALPVADAVLAHLAADTHTGVTEQAARVLADHTITESRNAGSECECGGWYGPWSGWRPERHQVEALAAAGLLAVPAPNRDEPERAPARALDAVRHEFAQWLDEATTQEWADALTEVCRVLADRAAALRRGGAQ